MQRKVARIGVRSGQLKRMSCFKGCGVACGPHASAAAARTFSGVEKNPL
jgi:hypothetical protein